MAFQYINTFSVTPGLITDIPLYVDAQVLYAVKQLGRPNGERTLWGYFSSVDAQYVGGVAALIQTVGCWGDAQCLVVIPPPGRPAVTLEMYTPLSGDARVTAFELYRQSYP